MNDNAILSALYDMTGPDGTPNELLKAMVAGDMQGRDYNNQVTGFEALKPESLDPVLKSLEFSMKQIVLLGMLPKKTVFNTVHEYLQLIKYGQEIGIFMAEGDRPENTDSQYRRKSVLTKYMGLGGKLTIQAQYMKHADGKDPYTREVENKLMDLSKLMDLQLSEGDASKVSTSFDGLFRQHLLGINEIYGQTDGKTAEQLLDGYFADPCVINANGKVLTETHVQEASHAVVNDRYGEVTKLITNPVVLKDYNQRQYDKQRVLLGGGVNNGLVTGNSVGNIITQFGNVGMESDIFFDRRAGIAYDKPSNSTKAPAAPTAGAAPTAAAVDAKTKFGASHAGGYYYAVTAKNQYGESAPLLVNNVAQAVAATESVDLQFVNGGGAYPATCFVVYRTQKNPASYQTAKFFPIFEVSVAELAAGYDGGAATKVRDRNRQIAGTHSAFVMSPSDMLWEYIQLMPTSKIEFAITTLAKEFAVVNFGTPVLYMPGKIAVIKNIGADITA